MGPDLQMRSPETGTGALYSRRANKKRARREREGKVVDRVGEMCCGRAA